MPRMQHNAPSFGYLVRWRKHGSTFWNKREIRSPNENQFEVDVDDVYGLYDVQVQATNSLGDSFQPVFTFRGHSGEGGEIHLMEGGGGVCLVGRDRQWSLLYGCSINPR